MRSRCVFDLLLSLCQFQRKTNCQSKFIAQLGQRCHSVLLTPTPFCFARGIIVRAGTALPFIPDRRGSVVRPSERKTYVRCFVHALNLLRSEGTSSLRVRSTHHNLFAQFLIDHLDRAVDFSVGHAQLMRNQLHQQIDPLNEGRSTGNRAGC